MCVGVGLAKDHAIGGWLTTVTAAGRILEYLGLRGVCYGILAGTESGLRPSPAWAETNYFTMKTMVDHNDQPLKNSLHHCGHTGKAVSGCGGDDAGVTAPYPLCDAYQEFPVGKNW